MSDSLDVRQKVRRYAFWRRRSWHYEQALVRLLRRLPDRQEAISIIWQAVDKFSVFGLRLARLYIDRPEEAKSLLEHGLIHGDASSIKFWLRAVKPTLSLAGVLSVLQEHVGENPRGVENALYHIPKTFKGDPYMRKAKDVVDEMWKRR